MPSKKDLEERIKSLEVAVDFSGGILERLDEIEHWVGVVDRLNFYMHGQPGLSAPGSSGESDRSGALDSDPLDPPVGLATSPSDAFCQVIAERNQARAEWDRLRSGIEAAANSLKRGLPIYEADLRALLDGGDDE